MARNRALYVAAATGALIVSAGTALALSGDDTMPTGFPSASVSPLDDNPSPSDLMSPSDARSSDDSPGMAPAPSTTQLTSNDAIVIAQDRIGGGGDVTEVEREMEHGRLAWKVELHKGGVEYDVRVDAATGTVTRVKQDDDDRDDDHDGYDDWDDHHDDRDDDRDD